MTIPAGRYGFERGRYAVRSIRKTGWLGAIRSKSLSDNSAPTPPNAMHPRLTDVASLPIHTKASTMSEIAGQPTEGTTLGSPGTGIFQAFPVVLPEARLASVHERLEPIDVRSGR